jgi:hypothetical protein
VREGAHKKGTVATDATVPVEKKLVLVAGGDYADALVHFVNGLVDVPKSALLEALGEVVVLFAGDILVRFFEQFLGAVQAAGVVEAGVNRRMLIQIFAVVDRRFLDFVDGVIDGVDGFLFLMAKFATVVRFEMGASRTEIAERMQVRRVPALSRHTTRAESKKQGEKQHGNNESGDGLHRHGFSLK